MSNQKEKQDESGRDKHSTSILKAISWRIFATITTIVICFYLTGNIELSASIGLTELVLKIALYYAHERLWILLTNLRLPTNKQQARDSMLS